MFNPPTLVVERRDHNGWGLAVPKALYLHCGEGCGRGRTRRVEKEKE